MPIHHTHWCREGDEELILKYNLNDVEATYNFLLTTLGKTEYSLYKGKNKIELRQKLNKKFDTLEERTQRTSAQQEDMVHVIQNISMTLSEINKKNDLLENGIRQTVADRVEQRIKAYNAQGYILDTEYDSFCDFADYAVDTLHCNHGLKRKYEDCKENIEVLSLEEVLKREEH